MSGLPVTSITGLPPITSGGIPASPIASDPLFGVSPFSPSNYQTGVDFSLGLPDLQTRRAQQQRLQQMAQLSTLGLAPDSDPTTWTPEEAAAQTDNAIAKISTVNPEVAQRLAEQRAPDEDDGHSFWDSIKDVAGDILSPGLEIAGRVLDIVGRTANIVPNLAFDTVNGGDFNFAGDVGGALSGTTRHNWNSVFQEMGWEGDGIGGFLRATVGLVGDIGTDPLTWLIPAGTALGGAEKAALAGRTAATRSSTIVERAATLFAEDGASLTSKLEQTYDLIAKGGGSKVFRAANEDAPEIIGGLLGESVSTAQTQLLDDMFRISDKTYRGIRARGFNTWARNGSITLADGSEVTGRQLQEVLAKAIKSGNLSGKAIGSASGDWKAARALASAVGGTRLKVNVPFTNLRYISGALPGSAIFGEKTLGVASRMLSGQSGMNRMLAAIGKGDANWSDLITWQEQGFKAAFDANPEMVKGLRGRFQNLGSMFYSASEEMGQITGAFSSGAKATRAGLGGYLSHAAALESKQTANRIAREAAYEVELRSGKKVDRQGFLRTVEAQLGVSHRTKGQTASQELMDNMARHTHWFPDSLDTSDPAAIEAWFWSDPAHWEASAVGERGEQVLQHSKLAEAKLARMQEVAASWSPAQREALDMVATIQKHLRLEAAKRDAALATVGFDFTRSGVIHNAQVGEWQMGTHPALQEPFYMDVTDATRAGRVPYSGVDESDLVAGEYAHGLEATRAAGGGRGTTSAGKQVEVRINADDVYVIDRRQGAVLSDEDQLITWRDEAAQAAEDTRAAAKEAVDGVDLPVVSDLEKRDTASRLSTEAIRRHNPDKKGILTIEADGSMHVSVFDPQNVKVASDNAAHLVPETQGYFHRTFTEAARKLFTGDSARVGQHFTIPNTEIEAYLSRRTIGMDVDEAEDYMQKYLRALFGEEADIPDHIWNTNVLEVHEDYVDNVTKAIQAEMLGNNAKRMVLLGDVSPSMFGHTPRSQKYEWMLAPELQHTLSRMDTKLTRAIMESHARDAKLLEQQQQALQKAAEEHGLFAAMVEESLANGVEVPSRYVEAVRRYGSTRAEAAAKTQAERVGLDSTETQLQGHVAAYEAAAESMASDPRYGHPGKNSPISIIENPDGTQTIRGWHFTENGGIPAENVAGIDMSSGGFHFGDYETAKRRAQAAVGEENIGERGDPSTWPTEIRDVTPNLAPLPGESTDAYILRNEAQEQVLVEVPVEPARYYDEFLYPVEARGNFKGAKQGEAVPTEGPIEEGGLGMSFSGSNEGFSAGKADERGQLQSQGYTGATYTNRVELAGEGGTTGTTSVVVLEPSDVVISNPRAAFEKDIADGKLAWDAAQGKVTAGRPKGSRKLRPLAEVNDELAFVQARRAELDSVDRMLAEGADEAVPNVARRGPRHKVNLSRTGENFQVTVGKGSYVYAKLTPEGDLQVYSTLVDKTARRQGIGTAMYEKLAETADALGGRLVSDELGSRTPEADALWRALQKRGYDVVEEDGRFVMRHQTLPNTQKVAAAGAGVARETRALEERIAKNASATGRRLQRAKTLTQHAQAEANKQYAEFHGQVAKIQPALVKSTETLGKGMTQLHVPGLEGYAMPSYIAEEFHAAIDKYGAQGLQKAWRTYVMGPWKRWATYRWPGFHVRNFFGAFFNNWLGGVTLDDYVFSWRVNHARDGSLKWAARKVDQATADRLHLGNHFGEVLPTYGEVADLLADQGVGRANTMAVMGIGATNDASKEAYHVVGHKNPNAVRRAARRFDDTMRSMGSSVEDFHRVAAWSTGMSATRGDSYGARAFVMMRHGDYSDLTGAEQYVKDVIPFYKWMRTNVPYQIRMLAENPSQLTLVHDKLRRWAFDAQGIDMAQAELQMPDYMRQTLSVPIPSWVPVIGSKDKDALKFAMFDLPYADLYNGLSDYMSSALPIGRNVLESYGFNQTLFSGVPLTGEYKPLSGVFNIPGVRDLLHLAKLTKRGPDGQEYIEDKLQNVLMAWPIFSRFRNFTESDPERVDSRVGGLFSMMAGVGIKPGNFTDTELDFYYNEVQPLLDQYRSLGIQLPTVDDFQSGSVGASVGLTSAEDVPSPVFGTITAAAA